MPPFWAAFLVAENFLGKSFPHPSTTFFENPFCEKGFHNRMLSVLV
jgi:hypothetical protein